MVENAFPCPLSRLAVGGGRAYSAALGRSETKCASRPRLQAGIRPMSAVHTARRRCHRTSALFAAKYNAQRQSRTLRSMLALHAVTIQSLKRAVPEAVRKSASTSDNE